MNAEFAEYGPWVPFVEFNTGDSDYGQSVYFDEQGNKYLVGQGPIQALQTASHTDMNIVGQVNQQLQNSGLATPATTYQPVNQSQGNNNNNNNNENPVIQMIQEILGNQLISGIPNWLLLGGAVLGFLRSK